MRTRHKIGLSFLGVCFLVIAVLRLLVGNGVLWR